MENIYQSILDIEKKARQIVDEVSTVREQIDQEKQNLLNSEKDYLEKAKKKVADFEISEQQYIKESLEKIDLSLQQAKKELDDKVKSNKDKWINSMFENIIE